MASASKSFAITVGTLSGPNAPLTDPVKLLPVLNVPVVCSNFIVVPLVTDACTTPVAPLPACVSVYPATTVTFPDVVIVKIVPRSKNWSSSVWNTCPTIPDVNPVNVDVSNGVVRSLSL